MTSKGHIQQLPSGSFRVKVYAGTDPVTGKQRLLRQTSVSAEPANDHGIAAWLGKVARSNRSLDTRIHVPPGECGCAQGAGGCDRKRAEPYMRGGENQEAGQAADQAEGHVCGIVALSLGGDGDRQGGACRREGRDRAAKHRPGGLACQRRSEHRRPRRTSAGHRSARNPRSSWELLSRSAARPGLAAART